MQFQSGLVLNLLKTMSQIVLISECFVRPKSEVQDSQKYYYPPPLAYNILSIGHSQFGLVFKATSSWPPKSTLFNKLKDSLSQALVYFYPLAGRFVTQKYPEEHTCSIFDYCTKGPGARLIHASASGLTITDITNGNKDVPLIVQSFFDLGERQVNHDGHTRALLSLQMTELDDGLFIGCSINHCIADANSLSQFLNVLSQIFVSTPHISRLPIFQPTPTLSEFPIVKLPYLEASEFLNRFEETNLRDRIFCFPSESMISLKAKANDEASKINPHITLSSFKALCGHLWMSIARAQMTLSEETTIALAMDLRPRLDPPLSPNFFSCFATGVIVTAKVGELLTNGLGWATMMIHQKVEEVSDDKVIREKILKSNPIVFNADSRSANTVSIGGSARLDLYGAEFGLGKPVAIGTGYVNRYNGKVLALPGQHGSGSVDVQISLFPEFMSNLLLDEEFKKYVS